MKIKCISLLLIAFLFNGLTVSAQSWLWATGGNSLNANIYENSIATNRTGNVYLTGSFQDTIAFGTFTLTSPPFQTNDLFLVKYNQTGNVLWASAPLIHSNGVFVVGTSVATDDSDNSHVTGFNGNFDENITDTVIFGSDTLDLPSKQNVFLVKYDAKGNVLWAKQPDTTLFTYGAAGMAVTTDKFGHEYVTGSDGAAFLIKYDRNGNIMWKVLLPVDTPVFSSGGYSIAADVYGNVYMAGYFQDSLKFGTTTLYAESYEVFIAKFDSSGHALWAQQSNSNDGYIDDGEGNPSIATDQSGAVYLTSIFAASIIFGPYSFTSFNNADNFYVMKYNADGTIAWGKEAVSSNSGLTSYSICSDDSNHVYIAGEQYRLYGYSDSLTFSFANYTTRLIDTSYESPVFLLKLDSSGNAFCTSTFFYNQVDEVNALTSDSTGKFVYLGGMYSEPFEIGNDSLTIDSIGGANTYVARWQPCYEMAGINQITIIENQLTVYPNPTNNQIIVKINSSSTDLTGWNLKLIDILGRTIYSMPSLNYSNVINLETLPAAMYFITVTNNTGRTVVPVVKVN